VLGTHQAEDGSVNSVNSQRRVVGRVAREGPQDNCAFCYLFGHGRAIIVQNFQTTDPTTY